MAPALVTRTSVLRASASRGRRPPVPRAAPRDAPPLATLRVQDVTPESFRPYGWVLPTIVDDAPYNDAAEFPVMGLDAGVPRFYIMRLTTKGRTRLEFERITHHKLVDQTLASVGSKEWYMAVAPPSADGPAIDDLVAFRIPAHTYVVLTRGTWHAGPLFVGGDAAYGDAAAYRDFFNAELADTNVADYTTHRFGGWVEVDTGLLT